MQLSDQACGALMLALQNSLMNQTDILPVLKGFGFMFDHTDGLIVINPPVIEVDDELENLEEEGGTVFDAYIDILDEDGTGDDIYKEGEPILDDEGCSG